MEELKQSDRKKHHIAHRIMLDYKPYNISEDAANRINALSEDELEYAYRIKQRRYNIMDARYHAVVLLDDRPDVLDILDNRDYNAMAERYEDNHDCNQDDNSQWSDIVWAYIKETIWM